MPIRRFSHRGTFTVFEVRHFARSNRIQNYAELPHLPLIL
jgi:hypothetical protein